MCTAYKLTCKADSQDVENKMTMNSTPLNLSTILEVNIGKDNAGTLIAKKMRTEIRAVYVKPNLEKGNPLVSL